MRIVELVDSQNSSAPPLERTIGTNMDDSDGLQEECIKQL